MALKLTQTLPNGVSGDYWRIGEVDLNTASPVVRIVVHGYRDEATRREQPVSGSLMSREYVFASAEGKQLLDELGNGYPLFKLLYWKLKQLPDFTGAADI